jgi:hypothetical protein
MIYSGKAPFPMKRQYFVSRNDRPDQTRPQKDSKRQKMKKPAESSEMLKTQKEEEPEPDATL